MKLYAIIGQSQQTILPDDMTYSPAENEILMQSERPEGNYVARVGGVWEEIIPVVEPTEMDKLEAQVMYTAMLTDTLLDNEEDDADV